MSSKMCEIGRKNEVISLNSYIRDLLIAKDREICAERKSFADAFYSFAIANSIEMEPGYKFSREDAAERVMACDT